MKDVFEVSVIIDGKAPKCLGTMNKNAITFNRYNKGLLIAAGKLYSDSDQHDIYMKFAAQFRNQATIRFRNNEKTYVGEFCFINFIPETHTVVFGSVGPVVEMDNDEYDALQEELKEAAIIAAAPETQQPATL